MVIILFSDEKEIINRKIIILSFRKTHFPFRVFLSDNNLVKKPTAQIFQLILPV